MKKFYSIILLVLAVVLMPTLVLAEGNVAEVNGTGYDTIEKAMTAAEGTDYEVKLLQDVTLAATKVVNKDLTINLNGHSIKYTSLLFEVYGAEFTVKGTGSLEETVPDYAPIAVYGSATNNADFASVVNVEENVTLKGWAGVMVRQHAKYSAKTADSNDSYGVEVNFAGKIISVLDSGNGTGSGIYVNGNILHTTNAPVINIAKTANITSLGVGILSAGYSVVTVEGGSIVGDESGIEMRAGELYVKGGTIKSTATKLEVVPNGNGSTTIGDGIAVAQHTTEKNIDVTVIGGNVQGYSAVYESNPQSNDAIDKVTMKIEGGNFEAINGGKLAIYSEDKKDFISGGTFSTDVSDYVDTDKLDVVEDEDGNIYVGTLHTITVEKSENGKVEVDKSTAVAGQKISVKVTPDEGYKLSTIAISYPRMGGATPGDDFEGYFIMENDDCVVVAKFEKIEEPSEGGQGTAEKEPEKEPEKDETPKTGAFDIALYVLGAIALVSVVGTVKAKKPGKYSK